MSTRASRQINNETRIIKFQKKNNRDLIESLRVSAGSESARGIGSSGSESESGGSPSISPNIAKAKELGDITSPLVIDFQIYDDRSLTGNVDGDTVITFANIPTLLLLSLRLYIRSTDPIITIGGTIVSGVGSSPLIVTAIGDFLDITLSSTDQSTIVIGTVKKNDKTEEAPNPPTIISVNPRSTTEIDLFYSQPTVGTLPIKYDVAFSLTNAGNSTDGPDTDAPGSPDLDVTTNKYTVPGLVEDTTYFFWVRATNDQGNSDYDGPFEGKTVGAPVFTLASPARTMDATITFPPRISIVIIEVATDSGFTDIIDTKQHGRLVSGNWSISENELKKSRTLLPSTLYYVRARFLKLQITGPNSAGQSSTTGTLLPPSQPTLTMTSPSTGVATIKIKFNDGTTRDEEGIIQWRLQSSTGPYTNFGGNTFSRNNQPIDDLNALEDRIEIDRTGGWPNGVLLTFRCAITNVAGEAPVDTFDIIIDT